MGRHAFRGVLTAWMALIVLRTVGTAGGSGRVAGLLSDVDNLVQRALSPDVPAIPDRRRGGFTDADGNFHPNIPGYLGGGTTTAPGSGSASNPDFVPYDPYPVPPSGGYEF